MTETWLYLTVALAVTALLVVGLLEPAMKRLRCQSFGRREHESAEPPRLPRLQNPVLPSGLGNFSVLGGAPGATDLQSKSGEQGFFAVIELDRFTTLRSTVGFEIANSIIREIGQRIEQRLSGAQIGRSGHATVEFVFQAATAPEAEQRLAQCLERIAQPLEVSGLTIHLKGRVAFANCSDGSVSDELFDQVLGVLVSSMSERHGVVFADGAPVVSSRLDELELLRALPAALAAGEVSLHYQPKFDCRGERFGSAEALLRWSSPRFGEVPTQQLVTLTERTGMIRVLTLWVLRQTVRDLAALEAAGHELTIFVNVSGLLLADRAFTSEALALIQAAPGRIGIEITETAVIDDPLAAIDNIAAYSGAGILVAIDDFGSGVSSLGYLKRLPVDELKIDKMFIDGLTESHRDPLIVRSAIDLAHALEMRVTAEGVDDPMCFSLLRVMGCDMLQGYYIAKPMPLAELQQFLNDDSWRSKLTPSFAGLNLVSAALDSGAAR